MDKGHSQACQIQWLCMVIVTLLQRIYELEARLGKNSSNSDKPPSSDSPFDGNDQGTSKDEKETTRKPRGGQPGHKGHKQKLLEPTETEHVFPDSCQCGGTEFEDQGVFYTHQEIELPKIALIIRHYLMHESKCASCGRVHKPVIPKGHRTGYGPRFSALVALLSGDHGESRETVQRFCQQVLGLHLSTGTIQNIINRASKAILPHYRAIRGKAHQSPANNVDETPWYQARGCLHWLWVLCNTQVAFFMVHARRSKEAFKALIDKWEGILISDDYGTYRNWVNLHQTCLPHLLRKAQGLLEHKDPEISKIGAWAKKELLLLIQMANAPPTRGQWRAFYARYRRLIKLHRDRKDRAGKFVRSLERLHDDLWIFLIVEGVGPTNNLAERLLRRGVLWRKRSLGTESEAGDRWVERILSLTQTCRLQNKLSYPVLVEAIDAYFHDKDPDLTWIEEIDYSS
ncbi:MAG: IS66 family transposase [Desulfovermiculus sp.]|nr:IS66 family transposase [Desulfovermiculus sp.]